MTGAGIVIIGKNGGPNEDKQTYQIISLARGGDKLDLEQLDPELENEIIEVEKNQERYVYSGCSGGIEQVSSMNNYTPTTSLF